MTDTPLYVDEDINRTLIVVCPLCHNEVRTQGNVVSVWIVTHDSPEGKCPASDREVRMMPKRP
ncbi:hypothetical protein [Nocardia sp. alder85J]|uniref:hypothetical protein n=1 Tax=Nocardia sp. alder85J TaxID=2862949 RepID=UPI001CD1AF13|nr:hypothetical protein [Nocardia sp. alder85J]MCX4094480.1 hypothetical protein [Nocardia sp. alder85J]